MTTIFTFIGGVGGSEMMLIMVVVLLLFGAKRIPEVARGLGRGIREFKDAANEVKSDLENSVKDKREQDK